MFSNNTKFSLANTVKFGYSYKYLEKKKNNLVQMNRSKPGNQSNLSLNLSGVLDISGCKFNAKWGSLGISPIKSEAWKFVPSTLLINLTSKMDK